MLQRITKPFGFFKKKLDFQFENVADSPREIKQPDILEYVNNVFQNIQNVLNTNEYKRVFFLN